MDLIYRIIQPVRERELTIMTYMLGISIFLYAIHAKFMVVRNGAGEAVIFLPMFGVLFWMVCFQWAFLTRNIRFNWRPLWITIPFCIILVFMIIRIIIEQTTSTMAELFFVMVFIAIYYMARTFGLTVLKPLVYATIAVSVSVFAYSIFVGDWNTNEMTNGGMLSETNYDVTSGFLAIGLGIGILMIKNNFRLILYCILTVSAMLMTGSPEAVFVLGMMAVYLLLFHRLAVFRLILANRRVLAITASVSVLFAVAWVYAGGGDATTQRMKDVYHNTVDSASAETLNDYPDYGQGRFPAYSRVLKNVSITGHGFTLTHYRVDDNGTPLDEMDETAQGIAHNVPLVIVEQLGPIAAIAWLIAMFYCVVKSTRKMRLIWITILALCVFDHFIWTTLAPYWWLLIGLTLWEVDHEIHQRRMAYDYNG